MSLRRIFIATVGVLAASAAPTAARADVGTFSNPTAITFAQIGAGSPYPSNINVAGLNGVITDVNATLVNFNHGDPDDLDALLVGPRGTSTVLISDVGGTAVPSINDTFTLDDAAQFVLPDNSPITDGITYRPADYNMPGQEPYNDPAPDPPHGLTLSTHNGTNPNGTWSLYTFDDFAGGSPPSSNINGGWSLQITTRLLPTCRDETATIEGTPNADTLTGTPAADVIYADAGNDIVNGLGGNDIVCGGDGNDRVNAGAGKDSVDGEDGKDRLVGGKGKDRLSGGKGKDKLKGGKGKDKLLGGKGKDTLKGGPGNDKLKGGKGKDKQVQ